MRARARHPEETSATEPDTTAAVPSPAGGTVQRFLDLQASAGNRAVHRLVAGSPLPDGVVTGGPAPDAIVARLRATAGSGAALASDVRSRAEQDLGTDLGAVQVHRDTTAATLAGQLGARAFTAGQDIYFGAGAYDPGSPEGYRTLTHELAHTVQQRSGPGLADPAADQLRVTDPAEPAERAADALGRRFGGDAGRTATGPVIARHPIDVDLEVPSPAEQERLRQQGIRLPQASAAAADPRRNSGYVDQRIDAVGFGIYLGGYLIYINGLPLPIFVPDSQVDFAGQGVADASDPTIYEGRDEAVRNTPYGPPTPGQGPAVRFYRGAGGAVIAPTVFSPASTPRFIECALRARRELAEQVQHDLVVLAMTIVGGMALRALLGRIARIGGGEPEPPPRVIPYESGEMVGARMAQEMRAEGFRGNPFREFMRRLNTRPTKLPPAEAADAIATGTREFSNGTQGTMPPVQVGDIVVVPSRAPIPNAPVMGVRADGTVIMGRAPRIEIVRENGVPVFPPRATIEGEITWE